MNNELRWQQRLQNFGNAYAVFVRRIEENEQFPDKEAYQMALVQGFEMAVELAWKTLKDYLENEGYDHIGNGKQAIRQAFQDGIVTEAETWMAALEMRNLTSHTYNAAVLLTTVRFISEEFFPVLRDLFFKLQGYKDDLR